MCDCCADLIDLFNRYNRAVNEIVGENDDLDVLSLKPLSRCDLDVLWNFIHVWQQRHCTCLFKDPKNIEKANALVQGLLLTSLNLLKLIHRSISDRECSNVETVPLSKKEPAKSKTKEQKLVVDDSVDSGDFSDEDLEDQDEDDTDDMNDDELEEDTSKWPLEEKEKLFHLVSKVFYAHFPFYVPKFSFHMRLDDLNQRETSLLSTYCDLSDQEAPILLLRNVAFYCDQDALTLIANVFSKATPKNLPLTLAHAMIAVIHHLKYGLNVPALLGKLVILRTHVINYLCQVPEKDLRIPGIRTIFEYIWSVIKEPLDSRSSIVDKEGLMLALKYFTSSTLTMRLAGIAQINNYITLFSEISQNEGILQQRQLESHQDELTDWILSSKIVEHIFGPNLHVEVIKQSHIVLNFIVSKISPEHVDAIWSAAQLKHCSKQVLDLLTQLVKNMNASSVLHLYNQLKSAEVKDHSEQTLYLASAILKYIWSRTLNIADAISDMKIGSLTVGDLGGGLSKSPIFMILPTRSNEEQSSSSASIDGSDDEEEEEVDFDAIEVEQKQSLSSRLPKPGKDSESSWASDSSSNDDDQGKQNGKTPRLKPHRTKAKGLVGPAVDQSESEDEMKPSTSGYIRPNARKGSPDKRQIGETGKSKRISVSSVVAECDDSPQKAESLALQSEDHDSFPSESNSCNSSQISQISLKNMDDFEGEDSGGEIDEPDSVPEKPTASLLQQTLGLRNMHGRANHFGPVNVREAQRTSLDACSPSSENSELASFTIESCCKPGHTLLWDLLQDNAIEQLADGLAQDCEKILCNLVCCWLHDRRIRMKFIEGCLTNLENNNSVIISLRLLPKLLLSFQQFRNGFEIHTVTLWADSERKMLRHFFNNLVMYYYKRTKRISKLYNHQEEIQTRLHFLTFIFSTAGSPEMFKLTQEQVDTLWTCFANDSECHDELFNWLLNQIRMRRDHHALDEPMLNYILREKMPLLKSQYFTMTALELLQHLCGYALSRCKNGTEPISSAIKQLWDIALTTDNTDVSMSAIKHLNNYYVHLQNQNNSSLEKEHEFIEACMTYLKTSGEKMEEHEEKYSTIIQRALTLLKTHLEVFKSRYSYHLRLKQLQGDITVISHRLKASERLPHQVLRVSCQPAVAAAEKMQFEMHGSDYMGELRAEITHRWSQSLARLREGKVAPSVPLEGPIRLLSQGQELSNDFDEKTLSELGFKDMQLIYLSVGAQRASRRHRESIEPASSLPAPPNDKLPSIILLKPCHFDQLFSLTQQLGSMKGNSYIRAQVLSRRVWDIIQILPTSPDLLNSFLSIKATDEVADISETDCPQQSLSPTFSKLLSPSSPQKLIYSIQIVEWLRRSSKKEDKKWSEKFVEYGGLQHIFDIFVSGVLHQNESDNTWNEWKQDCLASLLQLIYQFGVIQNPREKLGEQSVQKDPESSVEAFVSKKKQRRKGSVDKLLVHQFNDKLLEMLKDINSMLRVLLTILQEATSRNSDANCYHTGFWGRPQVVHHTIVFLTSWVFSEAKVHVELFQSPNITNLLKKLVLDDPEPAVRREACSGFYKLYLGFTQDGKKGLKFIPPFLNSLLSFLPVAQSMRQTKSSVNEEVALLEKEPYGPGCKDYFWLVCRLVDSLDKEDEGSLNFDKVCSNIAEAIVRREVREMRHSNVEDEGLRGLLALMTMILKHNPSYKFSEAGRKFLAAVYEALFALPSKNDRNLPLCKVQSTRSGAFDLLVEISKGHEDNHALLLSMLKDQHNPAGHAPYPWDFWPHDDCRSDCGYVGLVNLGATCYMASCLQHLFMIPDMRNAILCAQTTKETKYESVLIELQKMFTFLLESERKSYNPKSFCKVYTMDHELLNTGEQKDMTEFFTDLIGKIEEMAPELNETVKNLFGGTLSNNVVSLDCPHISRTTEEFYTLRCKVADMRHIWDSLDELTVKDTLEGDNMYTCSQCGRKVRAEKRACIKKLPHILCFNTMRYTFNMITMMKEKVNTHFSFPLQLDMSAYLEENLIPGQSATERNIEKQETEYELIGVTVHTGTAEGGHYYCFIRERDQGKDRNRWYMFNDAEVKLFDPTQIGAECFGGEMTSKTYDSVTEKFMDFSFEKTNSAYMLFYERVTKEEPKTTIEDVVVSQDCDLPVELSTWIWNDNMQFARDKTVFDHAYFDFMWQICGVIPQSLQNNQKIQLMSTQLATFFVLETLIHSKEKPTIANWIELLTKQFNASTAACEWLMDHLTEECHWPIQILLKCPNQMVRQLFQRLCIHVITQLRQTHSNIYIQQAFDSENLDENRVSTPVGEVSCVTRFVKKYLSLTKMNHIVKPHPKHLTEYFAFLYEFAKMGDQEVRFLLAVEAISFIVQFYLSYCKAGNEYSDVMSDDDEEEDDDMGTSTGYQSYRGPQLMVVEEKSRPVSLDKMITLVAYLVEKSRGTDNMLRLSPNDIEIVFNGKQFPFLQRQIRDNINLRQTCNLICSLCRYNEAAASSIINMLLSVIHRQPETSGPFFRILSMMVDHTGEAGLPPFGNFVYPRIWEIAEHTPINSLEWLTGQVPRNKVAHSVVLQNLEQWVEFFLIGHPNQRVRNSAAVLLISLVPSTNFRQNYSKAPRVLQNQPRDSFELTNEAVTVIQRIFSCLLGLLKQAKTYADAQTHGTTKLVSYFAVMIYCLVNKSEKLLLVNYFMDLWHLFQPKLSEPPIAINQNKQALLTFWYQACTDCPENVRCIISNPQVMKNIAFNYILADHEDQDVIMFNRLMLPSYYGILRLCCVQSKTFTRQLAMHQNIQWAFKNITPYVNHYQTVVAELFKLMKLFIAVHPDTTEAEMREIRQFKKTSLQMYLTSIDPRSAWSTLISALSLLIEDESDRSFAILNNGIASLTQSFHSLFVMFHEATACHITNEIVELLKLSHDMLRTLRTSSEPEVREWMSKFKEHGEFIRKLILLLNTYTPAQVKLSSMNVLTEIIQVYPKDCLPLIAQSLGLGHLAFQDQYTSFLAGPYFPRRGQRILQTKSSLRPQRPIFQMHFHVKMLETSIGVDADYDKAIVEYFYSYYQFIIGICKIAISRGLVNQEIVGLCSIVALESLPLHLQLFPEFLLELASSKDKAACDFICLLCDHCTNFRDYALQILVRERDFLENDIVYRLLAQLLPKIPALVLPEAFVSNVMMFVESLSSQNTQCPVTDLSKLLVELRCVLLFSKIGKVAIEPKFVTVLEKLKEDIRHDHCSSPEETPQKKRKKSDSSSADDLASDETMIATTSSAVILEARLQNAICELIQVEKDE